MHMFGVCKIKSNISNWSPEKPLPEIFQDSVDFIGGADELHIHYKHAATLGDNDWEIINIVIRKRRGLITNNWEIPLDMEHWGELSSSTHLQRVLLRKATTHLQKNKCYGVHFHVARRYMAISNAFKRFKKANSTPYLESNSVLISCWALSMFVRGDLFGTKPCCGSSRNLFGTRCEKILS